MLSYEYWKIFKNTYFEEELRMAASTPWQITNIILPWIYNIRGKKEGSPPLYIWKYSAANYSLIIYHQQNWESYIHSVLQISRST